MTRNGIFTDYFETNDQSEQLALTILGQAPSPHLAPRGATRQH